MADLLSDDDVFGPTKLLTDDDVFGGSAPPAPQPAAQSVRRRGGIRGEASVYVPGVDTAAADSRREFAATDPRRVDLPGGSVLDKAPPLAPADRITPSPANPNVSPQRAELEGQIGWENQQLAKQRAARPGQFEGAGTAGDLLLATGKAFPQSVNFAAGALNVPAGGLLDSVVRWTEEKSADMDSRKSAAARAAAAQLDGILKDPKANALTVLGFLATQPSHVAQAIIESSPSMLLGAGGARGALAAVNASGQRLAPAAMASRSQAVMKELDALRNAAIERGATAANIGIGAGSVFNDPSLAGASLTDRYTAFAVAGLGYGVTGKLTSGGAEAAAMQRGTGGRVRNALSVGGRETAQETGETASEEIGKAVGLGQDLDPNAIAKQSAVGGVVGFGSGAPVGALQQVAPAARPPAAPAGPYVPTTDAGNTLNVGSQGDAGSIVYQTDGATLSTAPPAPAAPRVQDMPKTPLTPEQVGALVAAAAPAASAPNAAAPVSTQGPAQAGPTEAAAPNTDLGVARVPQGALADRAVQQLGVQGVDQPDVAVPPAANPGAGDGRGALSGGSGGAVGPVPAAPERVVPPTAAPAPSDQPPVAVANGGRADAALTPRAPGQADWERSAVQRFGATDGGSGWTIPVSKLGDVVLDVVSGPGQPLRVQVHAEYMGKRLGTRTAEGDAAIREAIQRARDGINSGRERMAREAAADERGVASSGAAALSPPPAAPSAAAPRLQNRDRSDAAYVQQMQAIGANPDPARLSFSRDFATGAPVVLAETARSIVPGRADTITTAAGRKIRVQYAAVEAADLLPSNDASGAAQQGYDTGAPGRARVVAGNGRAAGVQLAYQRGGADAYRQGIAADEALHGVPAAALAGMQQPVLVRVMQPQDVTANIGDESNVSGVAEKSAKEAARDDARRLDLAELEFDDEGNVTPAALRQFVDRMPVSEQPALRNPDGSPTRQAADRLMAALFHEAYDDDALLALHAQAIDPEARVVMAGLAAAAPQMAQLKGAGDLDIRPIVSQAAQAAVNARRRGIKLADMAAQADLDTAPETRAVLEMLAANARSAKRIGESLQAWARMAYDEAFKPGSDMFGEVPRRTLSDIFGSRNDASRTQDLGQPSRAGPDALDAGRQASEPTAAADGRAAQAERPADGAQQRAGQDAGLAQAPTAEPFRTAQEAQAFADANDLASRVVAQPLPTGGAVLVPKRVDNPSTALVESTQALDEGNKALAKAGWLRPDGTPWRLKLVAKPPAAFTLMARAVLSAFGIRVVAVAGAPGNGLQFGRHALVDVQRARSDELLLGVTGHEVKHWLDANDPTAARALSDAIGAHLKPDAVAQQQALENRGLVKGEKAIDAARARLEVEANINGAMWLDPEFWGRLYDVDQGSSFRRVLYQFMRAAAKFVRVTQGGAYDASRYVTNVAAVREAAAQAWAQRAQSPAEAKGQGGELVKGARRGRPSEGDQDLFAQPEAFALTAPTKADVLAQQQAREDETRAEAERRRARDELERKDRERRDIAARMDASAENFQLGQSAEDALSGQGGLFGARASPPVGDFVPADLLRQAEEVSSTYHSGDADPLTAGQRAVAEAQLAPLMAAAADAKAAFDRAVKTAADAIDGEIKLAPLKGMKRAAEKLVRDYAGNTSRMRDLLRATIIADSNASVYAALDRIQQDFEVVRVSDRIANPLPTGYTDILVNVRTPGGVVAEIQISTPEMMAAKKVSHRVYEVQRTLRIDDPRFSALSQLQRDIYAAAADELIRASNSSGDARPPFQSATAGLKGRGGLSGPSNAKALFSESTSSTAKPSTSSSSAPGGGVLQSGTTSGSSVGPTDGPILSRAASSRGEYAGVAAPFADDYKALEGRKLSLQVLIEDIGQTATFTVDAAQYLRDIDRRKDAASRLLECLG